MTFSRFLKSIVTAPILSVVCAVVGILCSALLLLANLFVHLTGGLEPGQISQLVQAVAKYLPLVFGVVGFCSAFITDVPMSAVFGSARWATGNELQKLSTTDDGLLVAIRRQTRCCVMTGRRIC